MADSVKIKYACTTESTLDLMTETRSPNSEIKLIDVEIIDTSKVLITLNKSQKFSGKTSASELVGEEISPSEVMQKKEKFIINKNTLRFEHHNAFDNPMGNFSVIHTGQCVAK
ncbi:MAG: hypothetical protein NTZ99_07765 [Burkholderiales bacterium]|nr:hypothetical protein [Burkholderiales bacterium]